MSRQGQQMSFRQLHVGPMKYDMAPAANRTGLPKRDLAEQEGAFSRCSFSLPGAGVHFTRIL